MVGPPERNYRRDGETAVRAPFDLGITWQAAIGVPREEARPKIPEVDEATFRISSSNESVGPGRANSSIPQSRMTDPRVHADHGEPVEIGAAIRSRARSARSRSIKDAARDVLRSLRCPKTSSRWCGWWSD
jgi:hypothetical protein